MLFNPNHETGLSLLANQLRLAQAVTPDLISRIVAVACVRLPVLASAGKAIRIDQLIESEAWTDAAIALIELELPQWKLRRLVYEDGEWHCCLSKQPSLPAGLDETAEASHEILPLAMLGAFLEARQRVVTAREVPSSTVPEFRPTPEHAVCCDNFA
jgi:hypothetical protein